MDNPVKGIIISVNVLSNEYKCSIFSYIRNAQNNENAIIAYFSFLMPLFRYAEIDNAIKNADNKEPTRYNKISNRSLIDI